MVLRPAHGPYQRTIYAGSHWHNAGRGIGAYDDFIILFLTYIYTREHEAGVEHFGTYCALEVSWPSLPSWGDEMGCAYSGGFV
jgi:hypothetical protein